jgi:hypothetical protein
LLCNNHITPSFITFTRCFYRFAINHITPSFVLVFSKENTKTKSEKTKGIKQLGNVRKQKRIVDLRNDQINITNYKEACFCL